MQIIPNFSKDPYLVVIYLLLILHYLPLSFTFTKKKCYQIQKKKTHTTNTYMKENKIY